MQGQVDSLNSQLAELRAKAENAGKDQDRAATKLVHDIHSASDAGIHNKKWYEKVGDWLGKAWKLTVFVAKIFVAVAGIVLLFMGGPLVWFVLAAALIVLADTIVQFAQGKAGWGDLLFAALDCIPVVGKLSMLAKAGKLAGGVKMVLRVRKAEIASARLIKLWHTGEDLKGFRKIAFAFGKGEFKNTLKDALNGGWDDVKKNATGNLVSNAVGVGSGALVSKGLSKGLPSAATAIYRSGRINMTRGEFHDLGMALAGKTKKSAAVLGATQGFLTSVTKATVNSAVFGADFDTSGVLLDTVSGYGDSGLGYKPGILSAKAALNG
ncbi:MAG: hypothetical protein JF597_39620 [Streptomyces sp.]|uniref:hypothetical protein n=1 Tax=Streptomyces sp. TaxID=1931 RepID=UPI0025E05566|nr:hypothetical protein [Streptomyces sp.]MBW8799471.1 hypothetical protein [Streptomyces sp.]